MVKVVVQFKFIFNKVNLIEQIIQKKCVKLNFDLIKYADKRALMSLSESSCI